MFFLQEITSFSQKTKNIFSNNRPAFLESRPTASENTGLFLFNMGPKFLQVNFNVCPSANVRSSAL